MEQTPAEELRELAALEWRAATQAAQGDHEAEIARRYFQELIERRQGTHRADAAGRTCRNQ
jgi:hypothetical protein